MELVRAVELPERSLAPLDFVAAVMRHKPADSEKNEQRGGGQEKFPGTGKAQPEQAIPSRAEKPQESDRVREEDDGREKRGTNQAIFTRVPNEGQANAGQSKRQVIVQEAHVKDIAVGKHGNAGSEEPWRPLGDRFHQGEEAPKENEDAKGDGDFFSGGEAKEFGEMKEKEVEKDIVPLPNRVNAGGSSLLDELREPGVVQVAAEITGFDVGVPEARKEKKHGDRKNDEDIPGRKEELPQSDGRQGMVELVFFDIRVRRGGHFQVFYRPIGLSAPWKFTPSKPDSSFTTAPEGGEMRSTPREAAWTFLLRMERGICWGLVVALLLGTSALLRAQGSGGTCPPKTRVDNVQDKYGRTVVADPYRWLENQESKETREWIVAQDKCTEEALRELPGRDAITKRLTELYRVDSYGLPEEHGGRYFFTKRLAGQDLAQICMRQGAKGEDVVLVDPLPWSADHSANAVIEKASKDGKFLYYGRREGGQDEVTVHILDVDAHKDLPDVLPSANYFSVEPTKDRSGIYYTKALPEGPRAYYHVMGTDPGSDKLVFGEKLDKEKILLLEPSEDDSYIDYVVIHGSGSEKTEVYLQNLKEHGPIVPVVNDVKSLFWTGWAGNTLLIQTNWKAPQWHAFAVDPKDFGRDKWKEVVPEADIKLDVVTPAGGKLVATYLRNASTELQIFEGDGRSSYKVPLPGLGTVQVAGRWGSPEIQYEYASFNNVPTIFSYDLGAKQSSIWAKTNVPMNPDDFQVEQVWYKSKDGTKVPMFLFSKKGVKRDGTNPVWLTAYGGFDVNLTPDFNVWLLTWVERGGIAAIPNLRGGGEFGEEWHRAGMMEKKQNVFDDFIGSAEYLIAEKYTKPEKLAIEGGSNGGLLVGAALTQRPDLYQAVVCQYPLEDMLRFQKFMDGPYWVPEYGSAEREEQFPYLYAYSPYHHVETGVKYPAVLFITGDGDTRVAPLHARKMAARLQAATTSERPILLLYDTKSGHSGGRPVNKRIEEGTDALSFVLWQLKVGRK
jgi:prolyl oligopeptidase